MGMMCPKVWHCLDFMVEREATFTTLALFCSGCDPFSFIAYYFGRLYFIILPFYYFSTFCLNSYYCALLKREGQLLNRNPIFPHLYYYFHQQPSWNQRRGPYRYRTVRRWVHFHPFAPRFHGLLQHGHSNHSHYR